MSEFADDLATPQTSLELVEMADMVGRQTEFIVILAGRPDDEESSTVNSGGVNILDQFVKPATPPFGTTDSDERTVQQVKFQ